MDYAFRKIRLVLSILFAGSSPDTKRQFIHEIEHDINWNARIFGFLKQIPSFSLSFKEWSEQTCVLLHDYWGLEEQPKKAITGVDIEIRNINLQGELVFTN